MPPTNKIPVDLTATGGRLFPPGAMPQPPRGARGGPPAPTPYPATEAPAPTPPPAEPPAPPPPAEAAKAETQEEHDHPEGVPCSRCGWPSKLIPHEPTRDEMIAFVDSVRAGKLYSQEVVLYEGAVKVTFRVMTTTEEEAVTARVVKWITAERAADRNVSWVDATTKGTDYALGICVSRMRIGGEVYEPSPLEKPFEEDLEDRFQKFKTAAGSSPIYQTIRWHYTQFTAVVGTIQFRASQRSFLTATPSSGLSFAPPSPAV